MSTLVPATHSPAGVSPRERTETAESTATNLAHPSPGLTPRATYASTFSPGPGLPFTIFSPFARIPSASGRPPAITVTEQSPAEANRPRKDSRTGRAPTLKARRRPRTYGGRAFAFFESFALSPLPRSASPSRACSAGFAIVFWFCAFILLRALSGGGYGGVEVEVHAVTRADQLADVSHTFKHGLRAAESPQATFRMGQIRESHVYYPSHAVEPQPTPFIDTDPTPSTVAVPTPQHGDSVPPAHHHPAFHERLANHERLLKSHQSGTHLGYSEVTLGGVTLRKHEQKGTPSDSAVATDDAQHGSAGARAEGVESDNTAQGEMDAAIGDVPVEPEVETHEVDALEAAVEAQEEEEHYQ